MRRSHDPLRLLRHWRRLFWLSVGIVVMTSADMLLANYGPGTQAATVETGASFSVSAGSFPNAARASMFAAALDSSGLPILVRLRAEDGRYQVLVGPYVSTDEAEHAQRKLAAWGLGESRLVVDDTMRARPQEAAVFGFGEVASSNIVMVSAAGMSSLVFEMWDTPKQVELKRTGETTVDVEVGAATGNARPLILPDGVSLVRELSVQSEDPRTLRAHLVVPEGVESRLRLEGKRIYVDLAFPRAPWTIQHNTRAATAPATERVASQAETRDDSDELKAALARFTQIEPFVASALSAPEADVLAALSRSLADLHASVTGLKLPAAADADRTALLTAIAERAAALKRAQYADVRAAP